MLYALNIDLSNKNFKSTSLW